MNYYVKGDAANAQQIKAAFEKLGIDVLDFGFADKTVVYCSIGGACVQSLPYGINLMHILHSHPGYKELELPVQPEFKIGDWVVRKDGETFYGGNYAEQITLMEVDEKGKCIWLSSTSWVNDDVIRLWTIADAKDGDVLALNGKPFIYSYKFGHNYCYIDDCGQFRANFNLVLEGNCVGPATKEQRDLLFSKMREAGCEWDADKKELRKILKVGDWVAGIDDEGDMAAEKIVSFSHNKVLLLDTDGCHTEYPKTELSNFHLWSIQDAKDGDVLVSGIDNPFIYDGNIEFSSAGAYVGVSRNGRIRLDMFPSKAWTSIKDVKPATKEQRDLLFAKLREAGCEWDADKKELRKTTEPTLKVGDVIKSGNTVETIAEVDHATRSYDCESGRTIWFENQDLWHLVPKPHYDIANFHAGMPVLVRNGNCLEWEYVTFSHYRNVGTQFCAGGQYWYQCIPFNDDTKHLLGTTDKPSDEYINW